jgi:DNA-binding phage protein
MDRLACNVEDMLRPVKEMNAQLREQAATGANRTKLAKEFGISRETLYQYIR